MGCSVAVLGLLFLSVGQCPYKAHGSHAVTRQPCKGVSLLRLGFMACRERGWLEIRLHKTGRHAAQPTKAAPEQAADRGGSPHDSASDLTLAGRAARRLKSTMFPSAAQAPRRCGQRSRH